MNEKPVVQLTGTDGNVFALVGVVMRDLKRAGLPLQAKEVANRLMDCGSYEEALNLFQEYVEVV